MGLPKIQMLPGNFYNRCIAEEATSPLTFFSTLNTIVVRENTADNLEFFPVEEIEVGMITEVITTDETRDSNFFSTECLPISVAHDSTGLKSETESCEQDDQLPSEMADSYMESIVEEVVESSNLYHGFDVNCNFLEDFNQTVTGENFDNSNETNLNELLSGAHNNDFVLSWLSNMNETSVINDADLELDPIGSSEVNQSPSEVLVAKEELRSFLLTRKTKSKDHESFDHRHNLRPRTTGVTSIRKQYDDSDSDEALRLRKRQERNRIAARKCRQKRTRLADELSEESEKLKKQNDELTSEVRDLVKELRMLQNVLLDHDLHSIHSDCNERMSAHIFDTKLPEML